MSEWRDAMLGDLINLHDHRRIPLSAAVRSGRQGRFPYYGAQGIIDHIDDFLFDGRFILIPEDGENLNSRKLPIAYFADGRFWVNNHAHVATAIAGVAVDRFVQAALQASDIRGFVTGAAQPKLSQVNLLRIPIRLPAYPVQERISAVLDAFDDLIENNRRRVELLELTAQAIYREWFVHFRYPGHEHDELADSPFGAIPARWRIDSLDGCCRSLVDGDWIETKDQGGSDFRLLQVSNIGIGSFRETGNFRYISADTLDRLSCTEIRVGDILVARMPDPIGRAWLVDRLAMPAVTSVDVAILTPKTLDLGAYLSQYLNSAESLGRAEQFATGTTRKRISRSVLAKLELVLPPEDRLQRFASQTAPARALANTLRESIGSVTLIRDLLLPKLLTGEIDVSHLDLDALVEAASA